MRARAIGDDHRKKVVRVLAGIPIATTICCAIVDIGIHFANPAFAPGAILVGCHLGQDDRFNGVRSPLNWPAWMTAITLIVLIVVIGARWPFPGLGEKTFIVFRDSWLIITAWTIMTAKIVPRASPGGRKPAAMPR